MRDLFQLIHREAAALAGEVSLLLTRERVTKRDALAAAYRIERLEQLAPKIRRAAGLPPKNE